MTTARLIHALTVDVEDYFHVSGFADRIPVGDWDSYPSRVVASTRRLLRLFDRHDCRGTFFILGWVADRQPQLIREIQQGGHEIGCHSYWHRLVFDLTPDQFRQDLQQSRRAIEDITGEPVTLYRAPSFSITRRSLWALRVLAEEGFDVDSSIYPIVHDRYGFPGADPAPHRIVTPGGVVTEFPGTVARFGRLQLPVLGGGYFRLYPLWLTRQIVARQIRRCARPTMFYIHPWEVDPEQPRLPGARLARWRHRVNLAGTEHKLDRLLQSMSFGTMTAALQSWARPLSEHPLSDSIYTAKRAGEELGVRS